jgi:hypothetical protein
MPKLFILLLSVLCAAQSRGMERVVVAPDSHGFILADSHRPFHPWGFNYGNSGRLIEDFWTTNWPTVANDFRKMKSLGANVVRVHLAYGKFMSGPSQPDPASFAQLGRLLKLAEEIGLYLDLTGLACYRPADTPKWYDAMNEQQRWNAQSNFWRFAAATCAGSPSVFCYDLINEPLVPGGVRKPGEWRSGNLLGEYDFLQFITLDPGQRPREDVAVQWTAEMRAAIRSRDPRTLITVGLLPWGPEWGYLSGFVPLKIASNLDFISVHIYPDSKKMGEAMESLRHFVVGKPVVIEETFMLTCNTAEEEQFLRDSRKIACGWIGHYDGLALPDFEALEQTKKITSVQSLFRDWQRLAVKVKPEFVPEEK